MAVVVTEDPFKARLSFKSPWKAYREFIVSGAADDEAALSATDPVSGLQVPQVDNQLKPGSSMICSGPEIKEKKGVDYWVIGCDYAVSKSGTFAGQGADPILQPPVVEWNASIIRETTDRSRSGQPLFNAAGDMLQSTGEDFIWAFSVTRYEPYFDFLKAQRFSGAVTTKAVIIGGVPFEPYKLKCSLLAPGAAYNENAKHILMKYQFEAFFGDSRGKRPFDHRLMNVGERAWGVPDSGDYAGQVLKGSIATGMGEVGPVRLDELGLPLTVEGSNFKVKDRQSGKLWPLATNPTPVIPDDVETYQGTNGVECMFFIYQRCLEEDLNQLF